MGRSPLGDRKNKPQVEFAKKWEGRTGTIFFFFLFHFLRRDAVPRPFLSARTCAFQRLGPVRVSGKTLDRVLFQVERQGLAGPEGSNRLLGCGCHLVVNSG